METNTKVVARSNLDARILVSNTKGNSAEPGDTDRQCASRFALRGGSSWSVGGLSALECVAVERTLVSVVDDDESVRESLPDLLQVLGFEASAFASAEEFLKSDALRDTRCLILDIRMPGMSGPELQRELTRLERDIPIIFITGQADKSVRSTLVARGAVECLFKPFSEADLRSALAVALRTA
jgi:CheY-like chemotaxis protein